MLSWTTLLLLTLLLLLVSLALYLFHLFILHPLSFIRHYRRQHIQGDPFVPIVGQALSYLASHSANSRLQLAHNKAKQHGLLYYTAYGRHVRLILNEPAFLLPLLRDRSGVYEKTDGSRRLLAPLIGRDSLFLSSEPLHTCKKRVVASSLHRLNLVHILTVIEREADGRLSQWASSARVSSGGSVEVEVHEFVSHITLAVICQLTLGHSAALPPTFPSLCYTTFSRVLSLQQQRSLSLWESLPLLDRLPFRKKREVDRFCHSLHSILNTVVADRRKEACSEQSKNVIRPHSSEVREEQKEEAGWPEERERWNDYVCSDPTPAVEAQPTSHSDLLSLLLSSDESSVERLWSTDQEVSEELLAFILAGHESTTNLVTWTVYLLLTHPTTLTALLTESATHPTSHSHSHSHSHSTLSLSASSRPVLDAILMESLRLYPPAPILLRQTTQPTKLTSLDGRTLELPANAVLVSNAHVIHRQSSVWGDTANTFHYERWLHRHRSATSSGSSGSSGGSELFVPFGAGSRACVGMTLAVLEAKVVLLTMVERMELRLCDGQQVVPDIKLTMKPKHGLHVLAKLRTAGGKQM